MHDPLNVLLLNPEPLTRMALAEMIGSRGVIQVSCHTGSLSSCVRQTEKIGPDVVLAREQHPLTDVLKLATSLGARGFKRLICISDETGAAYLQHLITLGVLGLLTGECSTAELKLAIESVGLGRAYASPEVVRALMQCPQRKPASPLEKSAAT